MDATRARPVVIGTGFVARLHVAALAELGVRPVAVWSPTRAHRTAAAERWGCSAAGSLADALDGFGATHVHVCSPPMQHEEAVLAAAARDLAVVCEKPLAPTVDAACRMRDAMGTSEGYLTFNRRMDGGVQLLRALVGGGELGRPVTIFGSYRQQWNADPSTKDWRFDPASVGPSRVVTEIGSHWLDLAEFVLGQPIGAVRAMLITMGERSFDTGDERGRFTPVNEDAFSAQLRFSSGACGHVYATELSHGSFDDIELRVDGTVRSAAWSSRWPNQLSVAQKQEGIRVHGPPTPSASISECVAAVYSGAAAERGVATFDDGVRNAAAMDAVRRSATTGTWQPVAP